MNNDQILTMDQYMLLSIVNMKLRDSFNSIEELCEEYNLEAAVLENRLGSIGYSYNIGNNQFIAI